LTTDFRPLTLVLINTLVPVLVLDESNGTLAAVSSGHVDAAVLTHLVISAFVHIHTRRPVRVRSIATWTGAPVFPRNVLTRSDRSTETTRLLALININTFAVLQLVAVKADALKAASVVETLLRTGMSIGLTLVNVETGASIGGQRVARGTRAQVGAGRVATTKLTQRWLLDDGTFVDINALALTVSNVNLVASVAQAAVRAESVDAAAVLTGHWHETTLV